MTKSKKKWLLKRAKEEEERRKELQRREANERARQAFFDQFAKDLQMHQIHNWQYDGF